MRAIFVSGTDTGVGKTIVTGCLARYLSEKGYRVITQKWIQTGSSCRASSDVYYHLKIMGKAEGYIRDYLSDVLPCLFKTPCSPHLAVKLERKKVSLNKIIKSFKILVEHFDFVIIEGIGGALVPLNQKYLVIDIAKELNLAVLVVVKNRLGAINHTLLTIEALRKRKMKILGIVFNNQRGEDKRILEDNPKIIRALTGERIFGVLPWESSYDKIYKSFIPIAHKIWKAISKHG